MIESLMSWLPHQDTNALENVRMALIYCQIGIYLFFAITIYSVWRYHKRSLEDRGFLFIALFFVFTLILSLINLIVFNYGQELAGITKAFKALILFLITTFSSLNSGFLFASFGYFKIVKKDKNLINETWIDKIFILLVVVSISTPVIWYLYAESSNFYVAQLYKLPDTLTSVYLFGFLGYILYKQFKDRKAYRLAKISLCVCIIIVLLQVFLLSMPELGKDQKPDTYYYGQRILFNYLNLLSNSALGTIFLALAYTWVFEEFDIEERNKEIENREKINADLQIQLTNAIAEIKRVQQEYKDLKQVQQEAMLAAQALEQQEKPSLKIGINEEMDFFFVLNYPKKGITNFEFKERKLVNLFSFLLSYAVAKVESKQHYGVLEIVKYSYGNFNNAIIQQLKDKLPKAGFYKKEISRDELLILNGKSWELIIPAENIEIVGKEKFFRDEDLKKILQALT